MEKNTFDYTLGINNIKDIPFDMYENDFTFYLNGQIYKTNRFFADLLSPTIRQLHYSDKTINEYYININNPKTENQENNQQSNDNDDDDQDIFSEFLQLCRFENNHLDLTKQRRYAQYFYSLGNIDEFLRLQPEFQEKLTEENAIDRLLLLTNQFNETQNKIPFDCSTGIEALLEFISTNFEKIDKEKMKKLNNDIIEDIVNNDHLRLQEEDTLLEFLLDLYSNDRESGYLFQYVIFNNVSKEKIAKFIEIFEIEYINVNTWKSICQRILGEEIEASDRYIFSKKEDDNLNKEQETENIKTIEREEGKEFYGIMRKLTNDTGGNIHENGTIEITSNSIDGSRHPKNLVDYQNNDNYYESSDTEGNAIICFDFKDKSVNLSSYTIMSNNNSTGNNSYNLKSWVIEVSNDGNKWNEIDRHENDSTLNGSRIVHNFQVQQQNNEFSRFIRLRQTGDSWSPPYCKFIRFYFIEFYGKIKYPSK